MPTDPIWPGFRLAAVDADAPVAPSTTDSTSKTMVVSVALTTMRPRRAPCACDIPASLPSGARYALLIVKVRATLWAFNEMLPVRRQRGRMAYAARSFPPAIRHNNVGREHIIAAPSPSCPDAVAHIFNVT